MKTVYLTIRVDFNLDDQEEADAMALNLRLKDERPSVNDKYIDAIEVCDIND